MKRRDGKVICPRNSGKGCRNDPRRNNSSSPWGLSVVGKLWATKGAKYLPADEAITFEAYTQRPASQKGATEKVTGTEIFLSTINSITTVQDTNILHFSLCDIQEGNHSRKRSETKEPFKAAAISHSLLDSGAIGSCVISPIFFKLYIY